MISDEAWMQRAYDLAVQAAARGEVPVGSVLVKKGEIIAEGLNSPIADHDPSAHAEVISLRRGGQALQNYRLTGTTLYVTLEPCVMCVGAMIHARIERLVFGALDPKAGAVVSVQQLLDNNFFNHRIDYTSSVMADECGALLKDFFQRRR